MKKLMVVMVFFTILTCLLFCWLRIRTLSNSLFEHQVESSIICLMMISNICSDCNCENVGRGNEVFVIGCLDRLERACDENLSYMQDRLKQPKIQASVLFALEIIETNHKLYAITNSGKMSDRQFSFAKIRELVMD